MISEQEIRVSNFLIFQTVAPNKILLKGANKFQKPTHPPFKSSKYIHAIFMKINY